MCIAIVSTRHPDYRLVLVSNRDEFIGRPTAQANWWPAQDSHVLAGRDLLRDVHGTWLGVTRDGRVAFLTNFKDNLAPRGLESRGAIVKAFLEPLPSAAPQVLDFLSSLLAGDRIRKAGGLSLMCGFANGLLAIVSNRTSHACVFDAAAENEKVTLALSNVAFGDKSWEKVTAGESLMETAIDVSFASAESEEDFVNRLFDLLNKNDFKGARSFSAFNEDMVAQLQASIFIPLLWVEAPVQKKKGQCIDLHRTSTALGTTQQTIILFGRDNQVKFVERTLFNSDGRTLSLDERDQVFEFSIEACALQNSKN